MSLDIGLVQWIKSQAGSIITCGGYDCWLCMLGHHQPRLHLEIEEMNNYGRLC